MKYFNIRAEKEFLWEINKHLFFKLHPYNVENTH